MHRRYFVLAPAIGAPAQTNPEITVPEKISQWQVHPRRRRRNSPYIHAFDGIFNELFFPLPRNQTYTHAFDGIFKEVFFSPCPAIDRYSASTKIMSGTGLEPVPLALSKTSISEKRGTESGTLNAPNTFQPPKEPDLVLVIERWHKLPGYVRRAIKELIKSE